MLYIPNVYDDEYVSHGGFTIEAHMGDGDFPAVFISGYLGVIFIRDYNQKASNIDFRVLR